MHDLEGEINKKVGPRIMYLAKAYRNSMEGHRLSFSHQCKYRCSPGFHRFSTNKIILR